MKRTQQLGFELDETKRARKDDIRQFMPDGVRGRFSEYQFLVALIVYAVPNNRWRKKRDKSYQSAIKHGRLSWVPGSMIRSQCGRQALVVPNAEKWSSSIMTHLRAWSIPSTEGRT